MQRNSEQMVSGFDALQLQIYSKILDGTVERYRDRDSVSRSMNDPESAKS